MSLRQIFSGSLVSGERLMQARDFYCPTRTCLPVEATYAKWVRRVSVLSELGSARELASLPDDELTELEAEFVRCPTRLRSDWLRYGVPLGTLMVAFGGAGLFLERWAGRSWDGAYNYPQMLSVAILLMGLLSLGAGVLSAFSMLHLDVCHGTTGLYAGRLDEQHPWIYKTASLLSTAAAEQYRQAVLRDRGPLRGVDFVIMREIAQAHQALERTRSTRSVAEQLQLAVVPDHSEPRLVRVASRACPPGR